MDFGKEERCFRAILLGDILYEVHLVSDPHPAAVNIPKFG
jgi:hypothetical protein